MATYRGDSRKALAALSTPRAQALLVLGAVIGLGVLLSILNVPLAASAANQVNVIHIPEAAPRDPQSPLWERAEEAEIALSAQQIYQPGGGTTRAVRVRALEDGQSLAIRMSWDDASKNDGLRGVPSDSAAIQLPMDPSHLPYQCMGQSTSRVNIWQWKATLEREALDNPSVITMDTGGTRNLTSNGICKAVETAGTEPSATSFHDGEEWHLVFHRALGATPGAAPLNLEEATSIAFAIWNGERGETRGMKSVSTWNGLIFDTPDEGNLGNLVTLGAVIALSIGVVLWAMRRYAG